MIHPYTHYLSSFPEAIYPPVNPTEYTNRCLRGYEIMAHSRACIGGLARNIAWNSNNLQARLIKTTSLFKSCDIVFFENDSDDGTQNILEHWPIKLLTTVLGDKQLTGTGLARRINMAGYRNQYLRWIQDRLDKYDLVIIIDTDTYGWSYDGIANSCSYFPQYDVFGSNGLIYISQRMYYDTYAYREIDQTKHITQQNLLEKNRGDEPYLVNSCFGGLAIYKASVLKDTKYEYWDCDHVTIHQQIRKNGYKIVMNPSQIVLYSPHFYQLTNKGNDETSQYSSTSK